MVWHQNDKYLLARPNPVNYSGHKTAPDQTLLPNFLPSFAILSFSSAAERRS